MGTKIVPKVFDGKWWDRSGSKVVEYPKEKVGWQSQCYFMDEKKAVLGPNARYKSTH